MTATTVSTGTGTALLMVWADIPPALEEDFNDWYDHEHLRERMEVPGFVRARRYAALTGQPRYLALYEARDAGVLRSEPYLRLKRVRDERTLYFTRRFERTIKATCEVALHAGEGAGAFLTLLPIAIENGKRDSFRAWLRDVLFPQLMEMPDVTTATYARHDGSTREAAAAHDVRSGDRHAEHVLLIEAASERAAALAAAALDLRTLDAVGARPQFVEGPRVLRSVYALHA